MKKNILVAVSGLTPQIITEAFFCLWIKKNIPVHEIYILTTRRGRDIILKADSKFKYPPLKKELHDLCNQYKIPFPKFEINDQHIICAKEQSIELYDIRTDKHNILFPNKVCDVISNLTSDPDNTLYCCISGGRKTMSVYLAFALSLFGRSDDKLMHVLTSEENAFKNFYPKSKKEAKELEIAEIPYVRLRKYLKEQKKSGKIKNFRYDLLVKLTQNEISPEDETKMYLNTKSSLIQFAGNDPVKIPPVEMKLYSFVVKTLKERNTNSIHKKDIIEYLFPASINGDRNTLSVISKLNNNIRKAVSNLDLENLYRITGPSEHGAEYYGILQDPIYFEID